MNEWSKIELQPEISELRSLIKKFKSEQRNSADMGNINKKLSYRVKWLDGNFTLQLRVRSGMIINLEHCLSYPYH